MSSIDFESVIADLMEKAQALVNGEAVTTEDLVYLAKALETVGPDSQVLEIAKAGTKYKQEVQDAFDNLFGAFEQQTVELTTTAQTNLEQLRDAALAEVESSAAAEVDRISEGLLPVGTTVEVAGDTELESPTYVPLDGTIYPRGVYPQLDDVFPRKTLAMAAQALMAPPTTQGGLFGNTAAFVRVSGDGLTLLYLRSGGGSFGLIVRVYKRSSQSEPFQIIESPIAGESRTIYPANHRTIWPELSYDGKYWFAMTSEDSQRPVLFRWNEEIQKYEWELTTAMHDTSMNNSLFSSGNLFTPCGKYVMWMAGYDTNNRSYVRPHLHPFYPDISNGVVGSRKFLNTSARFNPRVDFPMQWVEYGDYIGLMGPSMTADHIYILWMDKDTYDEVEPRHYRITSAARPNGVESLSSISSCVAPASLSDNDYFRLVARTDAGLWIVEFDLDEQGLPVTSFRLVGEVYTPPYTHSQRSRMLLDKSTDTILLPHNNVHTHPTFRLRADRWAGITVVGVIPPVQDGLSSTTNEGLCSMSDDGYVLGFDMRPINTSTSEGCIVMDAQDYLELPNLPARDARNKTYIRAEEV